MIDLPGRYGNKIEIETTSWLHWLGWRQLLIRGGIMNNGPTLSLVMGQPGSLLRLPLRLLCSPPLNSQ